MRKRLMLLSASALFLFACGNSETDEMANEENDHLTEETIDSSTSDENEEVEADDENSENEENSTELTEEEAEEHVIRFIEESDPDAESFLETYQFSVEENNGKYLVNMFSSESDDEDIGSPLISSYEVDKNTGEVQEVEINQEDQLSED